MKGSFESAKCNLNVSETKAHVETQIGLNHSDSSPQVYWLYTIRNSNWTESDAEVRGFACGGYINNCFDRDLCFKGRGLLGYKHFFLFHYAEVVALMGSCFLEATYCCLRIENVASLYVPLR